MTVNPELVFKDLGPQKPYERVLTTSVNGSKVTLCFKDDSHGKNMKNIVVSLKDAYAQRVKNWA